MTARQSFDIVQADVLVWANSYDGPKFHGLMADSPYHLTSMVKRYSSPTSKAAKPGKDGAFGRRAKGFMNQTWDGGGISFDPETWAALGEHLYPGAYGMTYGGSRTYHRMAVAIEDAGFIIHPNIFGWAYGSGMNSPTHIDTQIENGEPWEGHRYGADTLKPALEPLIVFQKPFQGRPIDRITQTGAGTMDIDGQRVPRGEGEASWPSNFVLGHHPNCNGACISGCPVAVIGEQGGGDKGANGSVNADLSRPKTNVVYGEYKETHAFEGYKDSGTVARYFHNFDWSYEIAERLNNVAPVLYQAKPTPAEKDAGLDAAPTRIKRRVNPGGLQNEPRFADKPAKNPHPTVKSIIANKHYAGLILPPDVIEDRRLLVPFFGVGSEGAGALLAGWDFVQGIEADFDNAGYCEIADARCSWWLRMIENGHTDIERILAASKEEKKRLDAGQMKLV